MKQILKAYLDRESMLRAHAELIDSERNKGQLKSYDDSHVETKHARYTFICVNFNFPLQQFSGYEVIDADDIIDKLVKILTLVGERSTRDVTDLIMKAVPKKTAPDPETPAAEDEEKE